MEIPTRKDSLNLHHNMPPTECRPDQISSQQTWVIISDCLSMLMVLCLPDHIFPLMQCHHHSQEYQCDQYTIMIKFLSSLRVWSLHFAWNFHLSFDYANGPLLARPCLPPSFSAIITHDYQCDQYIVPINFYFHYTWSLHFAHNFHSSFVIIIHVIFTFSHHFHSSSTSQTWLSQGASKLQHACVTCYGIHKQELGMYALQMRHHPTNYTLFAHHPPINSLPCDHWPMLPPSSMRHPVIILPPPPQQGNAQVHMRYLYFTLFTHPLLMTTGILCTQLWSADYASITHTYQLYIHIFPSLST